MRVKIRYRGIIRVIPLKSIYAQQDKDGECKLVIDHAYDTEYVSMSCDEAYSCIDHALVNGYLDATQFELKHMTIAY